MAAPKRCDSLSAAFVAELDDQALAELARRLIPYLAASGAATELLVPAEAARRLRVHPKTLTRAAKVGRVQGAVRVGNGWRFRADELALDPPHGGAPVPAAAPMRRGRRAPSPAAFAIRSGGGTPAQGR